MIMSLSNHQKKYKGILNEYGLTGEVAVLELEKKNSYFYKGAYYNLKSWMGWEKLFMIYIKHLFLAITVAIGCFIFLIGIFDYIERMSITFTVLGLSLYCMTVFMLIVEIDNIYLKLYETAYEYSKKYKWLIIINRYNINKKYDMPTVRELINEWTFRHECLHVKGIRNKMLINEFWLDYFALKDMEVDFEGIYMAEVPLFKKMYEKYEKRL